MSLRMLFRGYKNVFPGRSVSPESPVDSWDPWETKKLWGARRALESLIALQRWNSLELRTLGGLGDSGAQGALRFL